MTNKNINSDLYWDARFSEDWETYDGPKQSRFFSKIAISSLPSWLIHQIRTDSLTVADWGCAQGDGTDVWASYVNPKQLVGIDFSTVAIEQASNRYPAIRFLNQNWLEEKEATPEKFDILFSSNTLEHFHQPYDVLASVSSYATRAIVLALPYNELNRISEHFYSFLPENIPVSLANGFKLVWSKVVDCRDLPDSMWHGEQIVLVYTSTPWINKLNLTLKDYHVEHVDSVSHISNLNKKVDEAEQLNLEKVNELRDLQNVYQQLHQSTLIKDEEIQQLRLANSMAQRELMQLSDWANRIDKRPIIHGLKKRARSVLRKIYHAIPLNFSTKQTIREKIVSNFNQKVYEKKTGDLLKINNNLDVDYWHQMHAKYPRLISALGKGAISQRDIFVFSVIDWHFRIQRPQHIARSFAKQGSRVFYFSNHFIDSTTPGFQVEKLDPELELYQIKLHVSGAPAIYFAPPTANAQEMIERGIAELIKEFAAFSSISIVQHAYWYPLVTRLPNTIRSYDCMDHHEGFGNVPEKLIEIEKEMLSDSDLVVVTSSWLDEFAHKYNDNIALIRNAGEYEHFSQKPQEMYSDSLGRKIVGYYGAIAEWFDLELIRRIAEAEPNVLILLVGNDTVDAGKSLKDLQNVKFMGEVPYSKLPYYLYAFDVCLLPFKVIPLTLATNPVKVYEYLASGKPVVCVDLPEIAQFGDLVLKASSQQEFVRMVSTSLLEEAGTEVVERRKKFANEQTWIHRTRDLNNYFSALKLPKISVIVLTYNNLELTKACLQSLIQWSDYPNLEIIVVDNASSDESPEYLKEFQAMHSQIKLILNPQNLGFAAGNNVGLKAATGDYLVMLNNDTVVTPGWLLTMLRHLQKNASTGLVGPITNNIGNEAKIEITYSSQEEMLPLAMEYTLSRMGKNFEYNTAAFFCVMVPRPVFEQVGLLDENFGRGFFEDDDYCRRIEKLGLKIVCVEDVFIHHHLSASFNKLGSAQKQALFDQNKAYYETKWGKWEPHKYKN